MMANEEEVQAVLMLVKFQIAALQKKANRTGVPTTNLYAQRLAKGLGEIEKRLQRPPACLACSGVEELPHAT
jgi:hypothetical protein